jgi:hypothetical protein
VSDIGTVGEAQPTAVSTPTTGTSIPQTWLQGLMQGNAQSAITNALGGSTSVVGGGGFLANGGMVVMGAVLVVGALLISTKTTVVQVASHLGVS